MHGKTRRLLPVLGLILLIIALPILIYSMRVAHRLLTEARGQPADIVVDVNIQAGPLEKSWNSYSQGGEEPTNMIAPVVKPTRQLAPNYIRIDHIYDHHQVVTRGANGELLFDFTRLDAIVNSILETGAKPFFSLSYMPPAIAQNGDIIGLPRDWNEWALVVQKTIERYSGRSHFNISDVYYEVWNEPDLFGSWRYYGHKNYLTLYTYASLGATRARDVNPFHLGGPATTQLYKNWVIALVKHVQAHNLRLDFISWHRYTYKPRDYARDVSQVTDWLFSYPGFVNVPRIISEWGHDSEIHSGYDTNFAAAHAVASVRQALYGYQHLLAFELVDGPDPNQKQFWGRWGLLTHPRAGALKKPRYQGFEMLNQLAKTRLHVRGEGTWVSAIATHDEKSLKILLTNYDPYGRHAELVPITIHNLWRDRYTMTTTRLGQEPSSFEVTITARTYTTEVIMPASSVVMIELIRHHIHPFLLP